MSDARLKNENDELGFLLLDSYKGVKVEEIYKVNKHYSFLFLIYFE